MSFGEVPWTVGPEAPSREVVEALRLRALTALIYADVVADQDKAEAAEAREVACQLRCQAAVVEALSAAYDELGLRAQRWGEFAEMLRRVHLSTVDEHEELSMGKIVPSNFHGRQLARRLRQLREERGRTQEQVGDALHMTLQKMNRLECGQLPGYQELQALLDCYTIPTGEWPSYFELWEAARKRRWWQRLKVDDAGYVALEDEACTVTEFQLGRVPALLQTDTYAQYVWSTGRPVAESRTSDSHPLVLMPRQERLFADPPLTLRALVHEPVLYQEGTDHEQLVQLLDRARLPNVTIQVVPQALGFHPGLDGSVVLFGFADAEQPDVAYADTPLGRIKSEDEHMTAYVRQMLGRLARDARSPDETLSLLKRLAA